MKIVFSRSFYARFLDSIACPMMKSRNLRSDKTSRSCFESDYISSLNGLCCYSTSCSMKFKNSMTSIQLRRNARSWFNDYLSATSICSISLRSSITVYTYSSLRRGSSEMRCWLLQDRPMNDCSCDSSKFSRPIILTCAGISWSRLKTCDEREEADL